MSATERELTLILRAKNLGKAAVGEFTSAIGGIARTAETAAGKVGSAFARVGGTLANGLGNLVENLTTGGDLGTSFLMLGGYLAGQAAESFIGTMAEKAGSSALASALGAPLAAGGSAIGSMISAAIPIGMALLPVLLVAALVAAIGFLILNPDIARKIAGVAADFVGGIIRGIAGLGGLIVSTIIGGLGTLAKALGGVFGAAFDLVLTIVKAAVGIVVGVIGGIIDAVKNALHWIGLLPGDAKISGRLPKTPPSGPLFGPGYATGGWAGLAGPQVITVGEQGPEYVRKAGTGTGDESRGSAGVRIVGVSEDELADMIERRLYFRLARAPG